MALMVMPLHSQEESIFVYNSAGKRDPFVPLVTKDGKLLVTYGTINSIKDLILEGILFDENGESVVILNDLLLKENDDISGMTIKSIEKDRVTIIYEQKEHVLKLKE